MSNVTRTCRDISQLAPLAQTACNMFMAKCKLEGLNVLITETYRSQERQNYLYEQGRTREGNILTWTKSSRHTSRRAWDICKNVKGQEYNDTAFFAACGKIAKELGITWGGTWSTPDKPHFEISLDWKAPIEDKKEETEMAEKRYNTIDEIPEWGKATVQQLVDKGAIADKDNLNLSEDMVRVLVIMGR